MDAQRSADVVHDVEIILRRMFGYGDQQIADMWERQLVPNEVVDGQRVADMATALAFIRQLADKRHDAGYRYISNRAYQSGKQP